MVQMGPMLVASSEPAASEVAKNASTALGRPAWDQ